MGVDIRGSKIVKKKQVIKNSELSKTFVLKGFERTLLPEETFSFDYDNDEEPIHDGVSMAYSAFNRLRELICQVILDKNINDLWLECSTLEDNEPYPHALCHLLNFADNEGYIGPKAVQQLSVYLEQDWVKEKIKTVQDDWALTKMTSLFECIHETAKDKKGFIIFS